MADLPLPKGASLTPPPLPKGATTTAPEQGNMYTQSAEDIVYDPMGIPLYTSSYGSPTKGATDTARKALTTTAALPINIATGVAKNVGGGAQTINRYLGGESKKGNLSAPEELLNAIGQIETGTQQQSDSPNLLKVGSMVGQAAPWMATGGSIPSFMAEKIGKNIGMGVVSALTTPEELGLSNEEFRNAKNKNIALQGTIGGTLPVVGQGASKLASFLRGGEQAPLMTKAIQNAREVGYVIPPTQAKPSLVNRILEGTAGKLSTAQNASAKNQEVTNRLANKALGLPEETVLTTEILDNVRSKAGDVYDTVRNAGIVAPKQGYYDALDKIAENAVKSEMSFPSAGQNPILEVVGSIRKNAFDADSAVSKIRDLRNSADIAYRAGNNDLGRALKQSATALEDALDSHLVDLNQPNMLKQFRDARQLIAKTYTIENALNKTTGTVDAKVLANRLQAGKPMTEELKTIGQFGQQFPKAIQTPERMGSLPQFSPLDVAGATATGGASYLAGGDKEQAGALSLATLLARPSARYLALSGPVQNRLAQQATTSRIPSAVREALPTSEEAKLLAKMLLLQRNGGTSENK